MVTAIASLSNYVGGALGSILQPEYVKTGAELLDLLELQTYVAGGMLLLMGTWFLIPEFKDHLVHNEEQHGFYALLLQEVKICCKYPVNIQIFTFGVLIGISVSLQGMLQFILSSVGFSEIDSGLGNTVYQITAALAGVILGSFVKHEKDLKGIVRVLHVIMVVSAACFLALCWLTHSQVLPSHESVALMLVCMTGLGASLMGMLPFLLQQALYTAAPASENTVAGLVYIISIALAAMLTTVITKVALGTTAVVLCGLLGVELMLFALFDPQSRISFSCAKKAKLSRRSKHQLAQ